MSDLDFDKFEDTSAKQEAPTEPAQTEAPNNEFDGFRYNENFADESLIPVENPRRKTRGWAIASLALGIASIACCCFKYGGLACGVLAILFAILSRRELGYFDGMSIAGLILGVCGTVFGATIVILSYTLDVGKIQEWAESYQEEAKNGTSSIAVFLRKTL